MAEQRFVLEIGRAMHTLGSPSYRVEDTMDACCRALGLEGSFFSTPTTIIAAIGKPGSERKTTLMRVDPGENDLGRLAELYEIRDDVVHAATTPDRGILRVAEVMQRPQAMRRLVEVTAHALAAAGVAVLFGGRLNEVLVASGAGLVVGMFGVLSRLRPGLSDLQIPVACAIASFLAQCVANAGVSLNVPMATISAIVVLLPGLSFTTALSELSMRHLAAGSARLMGTLALLLTMAIGLDLGARCANLLTEAAPTPDVEPLGWSWHAPSLVAIWLAFFVLLRASRNQLVWVLLAVGLGYVGSRLGREALGAELGAFLGSVLVVASANRFARWRRRPAAIVSTPGLLLLVPGSIGLAGFGTAIGGDIEGSVQALLRMMVVGGAIVAGLLLAGVLLPPPLDVEPDSRQRAIVG